jgi:predicted nucleic acid-binding protein
LAVLDTRVLVDALFRRDPRFREPATAVLRSLQDAGEAMGTTRICIAELMVGLERTGNRHHEASTLAPVLRDTYVLTTRNPRDFERVPNLRVLSYG